MKLFKSKFYKIALMDGTEQHNYLL